MFKLAAGQGIALTLIGILLGLIGAVALTRIMADLLYGVTAMDSLTFAGVSLLLFVASLLACYFPARRAMKVDPLTALRHE